MPIPLSGTVTFLFTGIDCSTRLAQQHVTRGTVLRRVTTQSPRILLIEAHGGCVLSSVGAVFDVAADEVLSVLAMHQSFTPNAQSWSALHRL